MSTASQKEPIGTNAPGSAGEVFATFLKLGFTSFGGPVAHLGYFREEIVNRRKWLDDETYGELVGLCQFLPGPASSQVGFGLGLHRAGLPGALAAFTAFTLPSAIALFIFALFAEQAGDGWLGGIISGLKIVAVAIVAHAVYGMARSLCPDRERAGIALAALFGLALVPTAMGQVAVIAIGALAGLVLVRAEPPTDQGTLSIPVPASWGFACLAAFAILLVGLPLISASGGALAVFDSFYRSGALVFGGGHVVLPLLEAEVVRPGWVSANDFLAGYGAAQAVPGPLFTFAAYLGAVSSVGPGAVLTALIALIAIFLPGFLLLLGVLPFWAGLRHRSAVRRALFGVNAAVVGILGAALYNPVFTSGVVSPLGFAMAATLFFLLTIWRAPALAIVALGAAGGLAMHLAGF